MQTDNFGSFLLKCRKEKKLTQQQLAEKLYVSNSTIYKWEKGISMPGLDMYDKLAEILGVSADDLIYCAKNNTATIIRDKDIVNAADFKKSDVNVTAGLDIINTSFTADVDIWKCRSKKIGYIACVFSVMLVLLVGIGVVCIHQNTMKLIVVDEYFQNKSVYNKRPLYNVIIEYDGKFDDEYAYEFSTGLRDTYNSWFSKADGILIQYVDEYKGRENLDNVIYKMVLKPKRNAE